MTAGRGGASRADQGPRSGPGVGPATGAEPAGALRRTARRPVVQPVDREMLGNLLRDVPRFIKLLGRLARDPRVSPVDKALLAGVIGYLAFPLDLVPDWLPVVGQLDDVLLLALALDRLVHNAGMEVLLEHWDGRPESLELALGALDRVSRTLPRPLRALLRRRLGG